MISKIKILLYLILEIFIFNNASLSSNDIEALPREQYLDKFNDRYFDGSNNPQWETEVSEVLQLLGVNNIEVKSPSLQKRVGERVGHAPMDLPGTMMSLQMTRPKFKWQYTVIATVCSIFAVTGIVVAAACYYKMHKALKNGTLTGSRSNSSNNSGIVPIGGSNSGDKKLAQSAQMYHYQHQKQQMIALEKADSNLRNEASDEDSEPDDAVDDFTVYECPGMAMGGELEVKNPLFQADPPSPTGINGEN